MVIVYEDLTSAFEYLRYIRINKQTDSLGLAPVLDHIMVIDGSAFAEDAARGAVSRWRNLHRCHSWDEVLFLVKRRITGHWGSISHGGISRIKSYVRW